MNNETRMSDKAKGKQRAYPMNRETKLGQEMANYTQSRQEPTKIQLAIRFVDGAPDMMLEMAPEETGTSVISAMREQRPELANKQLRLIHSGRMLTGHTPLSMLRPARSMAPKEEVRDKIEGLGRMSLSLPTGWLQDKPKEKLADENSTLDNRVWLHCAVTQAEVEDAGEHESAGGDPLGSETPQAYDRFTDAGLSSADVQSIRALFRRVMFGSNAASSGEGGSGAANGSATTPAWVPNMAEARQLESQWLDSITQPSIFEETSSTHTDSSTPLSRVSSFFSYLLPTTNYASPARATTQGLIFAFFFPFIAGLAVASETLVRPPAFFDGEIWPELNREAAEMYAAVEVESENDGDNGPPEGTPQPTQTSGHAMPGEYSTQEEPLVPSSSLRNSTELAEPDERHRRAPRSNPGVFDMAMDPVPSLIFSPGMQGAIRAGLVLNFVTGFYLWLYAS